MSDAMAVGKQLVPLIQSLKNLEAVDRFYSPSVVSIEAMEDPTMPARMEGIDAVRGKNQWWLDNHDVHALTVEGPFPHGERFILIMGLDVTPKFGPHAGKRMQMKEAGLYEVKGGKVVKEEFFYAME